MKKLLSIITACVLTLSLAACGNKTDSSETKTTTADTTNISSDTALNPNQETEPAEETMVETEPTPEVTPLITNSKIFRNSSWLFEAADSNGQTQRYLYNIANNEIIKLHENVPNGSDISGKLVYDNLKIYNAETGEIVVDDDKQHIIFPYYSNNFQFAFTDDTVYVKKAKGVFDNAEEIGCIGNNGNWIAELSSDNELFNNSESKNTELTGLCSEFIRCADKSNNKIKSSFLYDMKNNRAFGVGKFNSDLKNFTHADNSDYCYFYLVGTGLIKYDIANDCIADTVAEGETYDDYTYVYDNNFISYQVIDTNLNKKITVINPTTDNRVLFDLTVFNNSAVDVLTCTDSGVMVSGDIDGEYCTGVFDKNGEPLFEPILGSISNDTIKYYGSSDKIFVAYSDVNFYYNIETNTLIEGTEDYKFCGFDNKTNTLLIQAKNPDDGNIYFYIADANDPMNYYNPLEN